MIVDDARKSVGWNTSDLVMVVNSEKKEKNVKGDQCDPVKDPLIVKLVFSLGHNEK